MRRGHEQPTVITSARESADDEFDRRRKKYAIMMGLRALAVIGAATTYHVSMALALGFVVAGVVLPWCAVLVANDRPAHKKAQPLPVVEVRHERAITDGRDRIIDG